MSKHWTDDEALAFGRKWLAADAGWTWAPGQAYLATPKAFPDEIVQCGIIHKDQLDYDGSPVNSAWDAVPDFRDPGTRGHALAQVEEAWGCDEWRRLTIEPAGAGWCVCVRNGRHRPPSRAQPGWDLDRYVHAPLRRGQHGVFGVNVFANKSLALLAARRASP